ncbi:hypothetical protein K6U06_24365 [Acidiferrimicrobium sp. IK]|uniref:hypothetical protein n=1 Tax=Acidiferrimicrobium sp. IK TaxID=2871700 RepID=UPI0021CB41D4|nr:hypothetical protein [Acidiferrimicrobium sp. IK]MCU4187514.1 hypothetical protein [Acidiferrimicrobium sp. IK]
MAEPDPSAAHIFRYLDDGNDLVAQQLGKPAPVRPVVAVRLQYGNHRTLVHSALVDSGSERVIASRVLARELNIPLPQERAVELGLGGRTRQIVFDQVTIQLFRDLMHPGDEPLYEWQADVGFILNDWEPPWAVLLGRDGFFDRFTVTMHGGVPAMAVEPWATFDDRFGVQYQEADNEQPRYQP